MAAEKRNVAARREEGMATVLGNLVAEMQRTFSLLSPLEITKKDETGATLEVCFRLRRNGTPATSTAPYKLPSEESYLLHTLPLRDAAGGVGEVVVTTSPDWMGRRAQLIANAVRLYALLDVAVNRRAVPVLKAEKAWLATLGEDAPPIPVTEEELGRMDLLRGKGLPTSCAICGRTATLALVHPAAGARTTFYCSRAHAPLLLC